MYLAPGQLPHCAVLSGHYQHILTECRALPDDEFVPWPETALHTRGWVVHGLVVLGREIIENCLFCPKTTTMLRTLPGLVNAGFSRLLPGTRILPHQGYTDQVWRVHLGLEVPPGCGLRVGGDTRSWQAGQCLAFDDTVMHEAWNLGSQPRTVLLLDILKSACPPRDALP